MLVALIAIVGGLVLLTWSADRFVDGAAATARNLGMSPLLIGMVIVGFGTSVPEMLVSALAAGQGTPGIALGNAYGSNITNIALILGLTAAITPIQVHSQVLRRELPLLALATLLAAWQLVDGNVSRLEAWTLLAVFAGLMAWTIRQNRGHSHDALDSEMAHELDIHPMSTGRALLWLVLGLLLLIVSSRLLVWGAVSIARSFGISDLIIGLTVVAVGTSLPELASSLAAIRKHEHDIALGNIIGSNLFNTLAVVGIAGTICPMQVGPEVLSRDIAVMAALTLSLFLFSCYGKKPGHISRLSGAILLLVYIAYNVYLASTVLR